MLPFDALDVVNSVDHMIDSVTSATKDAMLEMSTEDERSTLSSGSTLTREYAGKSPAAVSSSGRSEFEETQNGSSSSSVTSASTTISTPVRDVPSNQSLSSAHCVPPPRKHTPHQKRRDRLVNPHRSISRSQKEQGQGSREAANGSAKVMRDKPTVVAVVRSKESDRRSKEQIEEQARKLKEMEKSEGEQVNKEFKKRSKERASKEKTEEKEKKKFDKERKKWEEREQEERERQRNFDKERKKWEEREKREQMRQRASKEKADQEQDQKEQEEAARKEKTRLEKERKKWEQREQVEKEREHKRDSREKERRSKEKEQADKHILVSAEPPRSMETDVSTSTPKSSTGSMFEVVKKGDNKLRLNNLSFVETGASRKSSESRANCINFHMPGEDPLEDTTVSAKSSSIHSLGVCPSRMVDRVFRATDNSAIIVLREYRNPADVKGLPNIDTMIPCNVSTTTTSVSQSTLTSRGDSSRSYTPTTATAKLASPMPRPAPCASSATVSARNVYSLSESEPSVPTDPRLYSPISTPAVPRSTPRQAPPTLAPPPAPIDVMSLECKTIVRTEDGKDHCLHIAADGTAAKFNRVRVNGKTFLI